MSEEFLFKPGLYKYLQIHQQRLTTYPPVNEAANFWKSAAGHVLFHSNPSLSQKDTNKT